MMRPAFFCGFSVDWPQVRVGKPSGQGVPNYRPVPFDPHQIILAQGYSRHYRTLRFQRRQGDV